MNDEAGRVKFVSITGVVEVGGEGKVCVYYRCCGGRRRHERENSFHKLDMMRHSLLRVRAK